MNRSNRKQAARARKIVSRAVAELGHAVERKLQDNLEKIAAALVNRAEQDTRSTQFAVKLAEDTACSEEPEERPRSVSLAESWAAMPGWPGESNEAEAETAAGSREPESWRQLSD